MIKHSQLTGNFPVSVKRPSWMEISEVIRRGHKFGKRRELLKKKKNRGKWLPGTTHPLVTVGKVPGIHDAFRSSQK